MADEHDLIDMALVPWHDTLYFTGKCMGFVGKNMSGEKLVESDLVLFNYSGFDDQIEIIVSAGTVTSLQFERQWVAGVVDQEISLPGEETKVLFWGVVEVNTTGICTKPYLLVPSQYPKMAQMMANVGLTNITSSAFGACMQDSAIAYGKKVRCYLFPFRV